MVMLATETAIKDALFLRAPARSNSRCESLLELYLNQDTVIQCDVVVIFRYAACSHERMFHLELERAGALKNKASLIAVSVASMTMLLLY